MRTLPLAAAVAAGHVCAAAPVNIRPAAGERAKDADAHSAWVELHASQARLVASPSGGPRGGRLAGLEVAMQDGWKTYWRMPGDGGVPPTFDWSGSVNAADINVLYPAPMRMPEAGGEVIGYKRAVLFPLEVTPQDPAKPVALKLSLELGICREICVPVTATFDLTLPPPGSVATHHKATPHDAVAAAIDRVPRSQAKRRPHDPELKQIAVGNAESRSRLAVSAIFHGSKDADVFVEAPDGLYVPLPRREAQDVDGVVLFGVDLSADLARDLKGKTLTVTLVSETGASEAQWTVP
jgi:DsbC/DsbD-like thiol-disulfide interchange protein